MSTPRINPPPPSVGSPEPSRGSGSRVVGVDVVRGLAVLGMAAVHVFDTVGADGGPNLVAYLAAGRSATAFAFVAGISLAFVTGGSRGLSATKAGGALAAVATRGVIIGLLGFLLAYLQVADVILSSYGLMFLLALPMLRLPARRLAQLSVAFAVFGPVVIVALTRAGALGVEEAFDPTLTTLITEPGTVLELLLFSGVYPVVVYLAYLCAGLAIGRLDLSSRRLAWLLAAGGVALAVLGQAASAVLLFGLGGLRQLAHHVDVAGRALLWEPDGTDSWWYLALPSPHANTTPDVANTLGSALAVLGVALLVCRLPAVVRLLRPLADLGSMPLTLYTAHLLVLSTGVLEDDPSLLYALMVVGMLVFAVLWRAAYGQGPLERVLAAASGRARAAVGSRPRGVGGAE